MMDGSACDGGQGGEREGRGMLSGGERREGKDGGSGILNEGELKEGEGVRWRNTE